MNLFTTNLGPLRDNLNHCLQSGMLSEGKFTDEFERQLKEKFGINHLITVNSGTSALHLALIAAGVKEGDEVILAGLVGPIDTKEFERRKALGFSTDFPSVI